MYEVTVSDHFSARHALCDQRGEFEERHAHEWQIRATWRGAELNAQGVLMDFGPVRERLREALAELGGADLNDLPAFRGVSPSAERVARYIAAGLVTQPGNGVRLVCVEVEEEPGCWARYFPDVSDQQHADS